MEASEILRRIKVVEYKLKEHKKNGSCSCSSFVIQYEGSCQCKYGHKLSVLETDHMNLLRELPGGLIDKIKTWQDQPTEDGYYWVADLDFKNKQIMIVKKIHAIVDDSYVSVAQRLDGSKAMTDLITGKWYGPITPPEED